GVDLLRGEQELLERTLGNGRRSFRGGGRRCGRCFRALAGLAVTAGGETADGGNGYCDDQLAHASSPFPRDPHSGVPRLEARIHTRNYRPFSPSTRHLCAAPRFSASVLER